MKLINATLDLALIEVAAKTFVLINRYSPLGVTVMSPSGARALDFETPDKSLVFSHAEAKLARVAFKDGTRFEVEWGPLGLRIVCTPASGPLKGWTLPYDVLGLPQPSKSGEDVTGLTLDELADNARNYLDALQGSKDPEVNFCEFFDLEQEDGQFGYNYAVECYQYLLGKLAGDENAVYNLCYPDSENAEAEALILEHAGPIYLDPNNAETPLSREPGAKH